MGKRNETIYRRLPSVPQEEDGKNWNMFIIADQYQTMADDSAPLYSTWSCTTVKRVEEKESRRTKTHVSHFIKTDVSCSIDIEGRNSKLKRRIWPQIVLCIHLFLMIYWYIFPFCRHLSHFCHWWRALTKLKGLKFPAVRVGRVANEENQEIMR